MAEYQASLKALNPDGTTASEVSIADEVVTVVGAGESSIVLESEYSGAHSFQAIAPDLTLGSAAGSNTDPKYLAAVMGNIIGDVLAKTKPILAGLIGKLSITGSRASTYSVSAIRGEVGDGVTDADGAFVAVLGGDSALTTARAAYSVDNENTTPGSGFDYGLDLQGSGTHDGYPAVAFNVGDIRFSDGTTQSTAAAGGGGVTLYHESFTKDSPDIWTAGVPLDLPVGAVVFDFSIRVTEAFGANVGIAIVDSSYSYNAASWTLVTFVPSASDPTTFLNHGASQDVGPSIVPASGLLLTAGGAGDHTVGALDLYALVAIPA